MNKHLALNFKSNLFLFSGLFLLSIFVGILSGSYPALFLSSFKPADVLKGGFKKGTKLGSYVRKGLVVFQFAVSLILIIGTIMVFRQLSFIRNKDLGFDKENVIRISIIKDKAFSMRSEMIKSELGQHPNILKVAVTSGSPGGYNGWPVPCVPEGFSEDNPVEMRGIRVGEEYFSFFNIDIVQGRDFSREITTDGESAVVVNETAARFLGWHHPVGKQIKSEEFRSALNKTGVFTVIGVVKDFHNSSLHEKIEPTVYTFFPHDHHAILLKIKPENIQETIAFIEKQWRELPTYLILNYQFLDEFFQRYRYSDDVKVSKVFTFSSILAIVLACMGLFGLASYTAERRIKEIGIRKVLGASVSNIILLLNKDFSLLVLIANVIAWPVGYYVMHRWLQDFAYRAGIAWWIFVLAAVMAFIITLLTISYQSIKAAITNPVDTLRYE
jgi:putative ABC transport system permease protein